MSLYNHRMTLVVPQSYINQANNLALIVGEAAADINTFTTANYQDSIGNLYAVCSTAIKPIVLNTFGINLADYPLYPHAEAADIAAAQEALDMAVLYEETVTLTNDKIIIAIDYEPLEFFNYIGLSRVQEDLEQV